MRESYLVPEFPALEAVSPCGGRFVSLRDHEVFVREADGRGSALTRGAAEATGWDIETMAADPWSPDGRWLFACAVDRTQVPRSVRTRFAEDGGVEVDYPRTQRAGAAIDVMRPHFVPTDGGEPVLIDLGDTREQFFRLIGWLPQSDRAVFARFSRLLDRVDLIVAEVASGRASVVISEVCATFLRPSTIIWTEPVGCWLLPDDRYLWLSQRDGWTHLYLGQLAGGELRRLTEGAMVVHEAVRWDATWVWFVASVDGRRPYDRHLFRVPLAGGLAEQLTHGEGDHEILFSPDGRRYADTVSSPARAPITSIHHADGQEAKAGRSEDLSAWLGEDWQAPEEVAVTAADGETVLHGLLYRPQGLDPSRRYPLVHWLYGGPQMPVTPRRFGPRNDNQVLFHALAAAGVAVFVVDGRGTPGRSKAFQDVVWRSFAPHVVADQTSALRQVLADHRWIDPGRIGVMGRSWGAHFALRLMAAEPGLYRAGVLVVPGLDPYGGLIYEPYLGLPQQEPDVYRQAEPWGEAARLSADARLLLMAGTLDSPCQWDMQRLSRLLVEAEVAHSTVSFAEQEHVLEGKALTFHDRAIHDFFREVLT